MVALLLGASCGTASGAPTLPTPASGSKASSAVLDACVKELQCDKNPCASNGGLKYCYSVAQIYWSKNMEAVEHALPKKGGWCTTHWRELEAEHAQFRERAMAMKSLGDGPHNTDDDLDLLLAQQQYELAYQVLSNSACSTPAPAAKTGPSKR